MAIDLAILYRGPLSSCNYDCHYCPFAKRRETARELAVDRQALNRFRQWVEGRAADRIEVFFTPWGEGLTRRWYRDAMRRLSHLNHVANVVIQTNLSCPLDWMADCDLNAFALWCTYHPRQAPRPGFVEKCRALAAAGVRFSVGVVGLKEHFAEISALREELPDEVYLWINAFKDEANYYTPAELSWLERIDPLFPRNLVRHASRGLPCRAGQQVISVDGEGVVRRCHFLRQPLGNLYRDELNEMLKPRICTAEQCGCHIGYVHLNSLELYPVFRGGILERIPADPVWMDRR